MYVNQRDVSRNVDFRHSPRFFENIHCSVNKVSLLFQDNIFELLTPMACLPSMVPALPGRETSKGLGEKMLGKSYSMWWEGNTSGVHPWRTTEPCRGMLLAMECINSIVFSQRCNYLHKKRHNSQMWQIHRHDQKFGISIVTRELRKQH